MKWQNITFPPSGAADTQIELFMSIELSVSTWWTRQTELYRRKGRVWTDCRAARSPVNGSTRCSPARSSAVASHPNDEQDVPARAEVRRPRSGGTAIGQGEERRLIFRLAREHEPRRRGRRRVGLLYYRVARRLADRREGERVEEGEVAVDPGQQIRR